MDADRFANRRLAWSDARPGPSFREDTVAPRAEVLRRLRWQQRECERDLARHRPGAPRLVAPAARARLNDTLDLLREAGEYVPARFYRHESLAPPTAVASGSAASVYLADLVADIIQVLAWFDPEPITSGQGVSAERPRPGVDAAPRTHDDLACAPLDGDSPAVDVRTTQGADTAGWPSGDRGPWGVGHGGGGLTGKPTEEGHEVATADWTVGDRVTARASAITARPGSRGIVVGFSGAGGHPLVDFSRSGRVLIRAEHLDRDADAPTEASTPGRPRSSSTSRLSATPRARAVVAAPPPPPPDWCDRPIATTAT